MKILPINFTQNVINSNRAQKTPTSFKANASDRFEKASVREIKAAQQVKIQNRIQKIYDEIYDEIIELCTLGNAYVKEIGIEKPTLKFTNRMQKGTQATYKFTDNYIKVNTNILEKDMYLIVLKGEEGKPDRPIDLKQEDKITKRLLKLEKHDIPYKLIKLTDAEKEALLKVILAHEIRHCVQNHVILSTDCIREEYKTAISKTKDNIDAFEKEYGLFIKLLEKFGKETSIEINCNYALNFEPKKVLDKDTAFKFSIDEEDKRGISVKDGLFIDMSKTLDIKTPKKYSNDHTNPCELDAYNFEYEYLKKVKEKENGEIRKEVMDAVVGFAENNNKLLIKKAERKEETPFVQNAQLC